MFDLSPEKIILVGMIALVVLGPNRLPQAARSMGRMMAQLRRMSSSFQAEVRDAMAEPTDAVNAVVGDFRPSDIRRNLRQAVTSTIAPPPDQPRSSPPAQSAPVSGMGAAPDDPSFN